MLGRGANSANSRHVCKLATGFQAYTASGREKEHYYFCVEEITYRMGYLDKECSQDDGEPLISNEYGQCLLGFFGKVM